MLAHRSGAASERGRESLTRRGSHALFEAVPLDYHTYSLQTMPLHEACACHAVLRQTIENAVLAGSLAPRGHIAGCLQPMRTREELELNAHSSFKDWESVHKHVSLSYTTYKWVFEHMKNPETHVLLVLRTRARHQRHRGGA